MWDATIGAEELADISSNQKRYQRTKNQKVRYLAQSSSKKGCGWAVKLLTASPLRPVVTGYLFSLFLRQYVVCTFCTKRRSLFGYCLFFPRLKKRWRKRLALQSHLFWGQKVEPFFLTFFGSPTCLWIPVVCRISIISMINSFNPYGFGREQKTPSP